MKKSSIFIAVFFISLSTNLFAQVNGNDDEITVTNDKGEQENIDLPEAMTTKVDSLLHLYYTKMYLRPDTNCNFPDANPKFSVDVYKERLKRLPTIIEMPYNNIVQKFIDRYSGDLRHSVAVMLGSANFYIPIFEQALETYGLPLELKYLPIIESGLNPFAVSRAGATGLWQFMITTAKKYGLEVNSLVDERRDPVKSSYAAARYLNDLYKIFGDWNLVIAAYNCGPTKIDKAIHRSGKQDYWQIYPYLPRETQGYVPAFIAANYIMNYYCEHNICPLLSELPAKTDTVHVNRDVHFEQVSHVLGMNVEELKMINPQYRYDVISGNSKTMTLRLPVKMVNKFIDHEDSIYAYNAGFLLNKRTEVAVNNSVSFASAEKQNYSKRKNSTSSRKKTSRKNRKRRHTRTKNVTIKKGDTLSEIAKRNKTTVKKLKQLNNIKGTNIRAGKKIRVK